MKSNKIKTIKIIGSIVLTISLICFGGYFYLVNRLKSALTGCDLITKDFVETIDFDYVDNWIVIKVKISGSDKEYPFFFDTGATTVISDSLLKDLNKNNYKLFSSSSNKDTSNAFYNKLYIMNELSIGDVKFKNIGSMNFDNERWEMLNCVSAYGIIGCNLLKSCCFQIDYVNKKITITDNLELLPNYDEIKWIEYRTDKQESPIVTAKLNDTTNIDLLFDTGSSGGITLYSPSLYKQLITNDQHKVVRMTSFPTIYIRGETPTPYQSLKYLAPEFSFLSSENSNNTVISINNTPEKNFTGIVGNKYLKNYNITLDYKNKRIGYVLNKNVLTSNESSYGFSYFPRNNKLFVSSVYEDSEVERMGICVGNEIVSINETKTSELTDEDFCRIFRNEFSFVSNNENTLTLKVKLDTSEIQLALAKYSLF